MTTTNRTRIVTTALIAGGLALSGCGKQAATPKAAPVAKTEAAAAAGKEAPKVDPVAVPDGAKVMFVSPAEGTVITGEPKDGKVTVHVKMGAKGIKVQAAGKVEPGTGHHHIIVNADATKLGEAVPKDATHIHYGGGQTETDLQLAPGSYKLTMQFANGVHQSYGSKLSATINIEVKSNMMPGGAAPAPSGAVAPAANEAAVEAAAAAANAAAVADAAAKAVHAAKPTPELSVAAAKAKAAAEAAATAAAAAAAAGVKAVEAAPVTGAAAIKAANAAAKAAAAKALK